MGFYRIVALTMALSFFVNANVKSQAMTYAKEIVADLKIQGYTFSDISGDIGAVYARQCSQGYMTYEVYMYSQYENGKFSGYEISLIKRNYNGL